MPATRAHRRSPKVIWHPFLNLPRTIDALAPEAPANNASLKIVTIVHGLVVGNHVIRHLDSTNEALEDLVTQVSKLVSAGTAAPARRVIFHHASPSTTVPASSAASSLSVNNGLPHWMRAISIEPHDGQRKCVGYSQGLFIPAPPHPFLTFSHPTGPLRACFSQSRMSRSLRCRYAGSTLHPIRFQSTRRTPHQ